jgi:UDPglucose 6-dehydrogenase
MQLNITIIGTGYVGLVSGVCFADLGYNVTCVDIDAEKIAGLKAGHVPIFEPGLAELVARNTRLGRLSFTTDIASAVPGADVIFIGVGTPTHPADRSADLRYVHAAADDIAANLSGFSIVVNKSTVPVGTGDVVEARIRAIAPDADFAVVSNPEFLREGAAIADFKRPDRIIIGTDDPRARRVMRALYGPFSLNDVPIVFTSRRTAELIKYAANAFLATKIAFINEIADLCEAVGADVGDVSDGMGLDSRIGRKFLNAGPGYGGSCFPKDTRALLDIAERAGTSAGIVEQVVASNAARHAGLAQRVIDLCDGDVAGQTVAVLGLAFKPQTDDIRETPAIPLIEGLQAAGANIRAFDPEAMQPAREKLKNVTFCQDAYDCAKRASALVIVTEWEEFRTLDFQRIGDLMDQKRLADLRNLYAADDLAALGYDYVGIGKGAALKS